MRREINAFVANVRASVPIKQRHKSPLPNAGLRGVFSVVEVVDTVME